MTRAFAGVDEAMRAADAILSRYGAKPVMLGKKPISMENPQEDEG